MTFDKTTPPATSLAEVAADAPALVGLHLAQPNLTIITGSSAHYEALRDPWNKNNAARPLAFIIPTTRDQLAAAVFYCASHTSPLPMTVRAGGHDSFGRYVLAGAVLLDLGALDWIHIAPDRRTVDVGPGVRSLPLLRALDTMGLMTGVGECGQVSVTGWACGGGYGVANGLWGMGADNIVGALLITPAGEVVHTDDDPELLWAVRGAGLGSLGVVCGLRLLVYPKPQYLGGFVMFPLEAGKEVLGGAQALWDAEGLPDNYNGDLIVSTPEQLGPTITLLFSWICTGDDVASGWAYLEKLTKLGTVLVNTVEEISMLDFHERFDPPFLEHGWNRLNSLAVKTLSPELINIMMQNPPPVGGGSSVLLHHAHGRAIQPNQQAVFANREEHYIWAPRGYAGPKSAKEEQENTAEWSNRLYQTAVDSGLAMEKGYWSFSRPEHCDVVKFFGEDTAKRLRDLKSKYNKDDAFPQAYPVF